MLRPFNYIVILSLAIMFLNGCSPEPKTGPQEQTIAARAAGNPDPDCNVLLITIDTVRADYLSCQGHPRNTTPEICELAEKGTLYENAYSPAPETLPALTAIFSYSMVSNNDSHDLISHYEKQTFLAQEMKSLGYKTAAFTDHSGLGRSTESTKLLQGFDTFKNFGTDRREITSEKVTGAGIDWLKQFGKTRFFLWLHYFDPHFNYNPIPDHASQFGFDPSSCGRITNGMDIEEIRKIEKNLTDREVECISALYEAELFATDQSIGRLLDELNKLGLFSNTRIILSSDHGEEFLERSRIGHTRTVYNELIHVPLMVVGPGIKKLRETNTVSTLEIFSLAASGKLIPRENVFSRAHHSLRKKRPKNLKRVFRAIFNRANRFFRKEPKNPTKNRQSRSNEFAVISDDSKVILTPNRPVEFYDLIKDPGEKNSMTEDKRSGLLKGTLEEWMIKNHSSVLAPSKQSILLHEETRKKLEALGYIQ